MEFRTVSVKRFREEVDAIDDDFARILVKIGYLTAGRASELCTKTVPWELLNRASRPYGLFMKYQFQDFEMSPREDPTLRNRIVEKAFIITMATAKRGKRIGKERQQGVTLEISDEEIKQALLRYNMNKLLEEWKKGEVEIDPLLVHALLGRLVFRTIALPTSPRFEPWTFDLLAYMTKNKYKLTFDHTRQYFTQTFRRALKDLLPPKSPRTSKNLLRHYRLSHLLNYYQFDAIQLSNYSGWTIKTAMGKQGMTVSGSIDFYLHQAWRQYFRKLLIPIDQLTR